MQVNIYHYVRQLITCIFHMPELQDTNVLFRALADPTRRKLLDLLHAHDGRTLNDLCEHLDMTRQGVTQHLNLLEMANLVATVRRGHEKLHFLESGAAATEISTAKLVWRLQSHALPPGWGTEDTPAA